MRRNSRAPLRTAEQELWTHHELLHELFTYEQRRREEKLQERLLRWANFSVERSLEDFELEHLHSIGARQFNQLREHDWLKSHHNLILFGPLRAGK